MTQIVTGELAADVEQTGYGERGQLWTDGDRALELGGSGGASALIPSVALRVPSAKEQIGNATRHWQWRVAPDTVCRCIVMIHHAGTRVTECDVVQKQPASWMEWCTRLARSRARTRRTHRRTAELEGARSGTDITHQAHGPTFGSFRDPPPPRPRCYASLTQPHFATPTRCYTTIDFRLQATTRQQGP